MIDAQVAENNKTEKYDLGERYNNRLQMFKEEMLEKHYDDHFFQVHGKEKATINQFRSWVVDSWLNGREESGLLDHIAHRTEYAMEYARAIRER